MKKEGTERSGGIDYTYSLFSQSWFGRYECRVDTSFLEASCFTFRSQKFCVGGSTWRLLMQHSNDGNLDVALLSENQSPVTVHFSFVIGNRNQSKSIRKGAISTILPNKPCKLLMAPVSVIRDETSGFVCNEVSGNVNHKFFAIKVELRLKLPENEVFKASCYKHSGLIEWHLKDIYRLSPWCLKTETFTVDGMNWELSLHPYGEDNKGTCMAFFLHSRHQFSARTRFCLSIKLDRPEQTVRKECVHKFSKYGDAWGYSEFIHTRFLDDELLKLLRNGWITMTAQLTIQHGKANAPIVTRASRPPKPPKILPPISQRQQKPGPDKIAASESRASRPPKPPPMPRPPISQSQQKPGPDKIAASEKVYGHGNPLSSDVGVIASATSVPSNNGRKSEHISQSNVTKQDLRQQGADMEKTSVRKEVERNRKETESQKNLIKKLIDLTPKTVFANKYELGDERVPGKPHVRFAVNKLSKKRVVLKFYSSKELFNKALKLNELLSSDFVCKAIDFVDDDSSNYPPCIVFERGDETLDKWMKTMPAELLKRKAVLFDVLQCLRYIHSRNVIHGDIKPSNISYFSASHSWKLLDTDLGEEQDSLFDIHYTLFYASPEVVQADDNGHERMHLETSADMFSFGILAFEVLTGFRFYGPNADEDVVRRCLCGLSQLPSVDPIEEPQARRLVRNVIWMDPRKRWSAKRALDNATFQAAEDTDQKGNGIQSVMNELRAARKEITSLVKLTRDEVLSANLMIRIVVEDFVSDSDAHALLRNRVCREAVTMLDDDMKNHPIFMLVVGRDQRLRVSLKHKFKEQAAGRKIIGLRVKALDGETVDLAIEETTPVCDGHEVVACLQPSVLQSNKLRTVTSKFGEPKKKYAIFCITVNVAVEENQTYQEVELDGQLVCCMVRHDTRLIPQRFANRAKDMWKSAPQWVKDGVKGTIILAKIACTAVAP